MYKKRRDENINNNKNTYYKQNHDDERFRLTADCWRVPVVLSVVLAAHDRSAQLTTAPSTKSVVATNVIRLNVL